MGIHLWKRKAAPQGQITNNAPAIFELPPDSFVIAFRVTGGIGDHLIAARYIRDFVVSAGPFEFDVYSTRPDAARWIFAGIKGYRETHSEFFSWERNYRAYPLAMWVVTFATIYQTEANWDLINEKHPKIANVAEACARTYQRIEPMIRHHPRLDYALGQYVVYRGYTRHTGLHWMSGLTYGGNLLDLPTDADALNKFGLTPGGYVTVHNGFDAEFFSGAADSKISTKVYPKFSEVITRLRAEFPDLAVVQMGTKTSAPIDGVTHQLIGQTNLLEMAEILRQSRLHFDNEGGLVHLASSLGTKSCVVFGPTPVDYFGYEGNINIRPNFCGGCWWTSDDWMSNCVRGYKEARCVTGIPPERVFEAALPVLL